MTSWPKTSRTLHLANISQIKANLEIAVNVKKTNASQIRKKYVGQYTVKFWLLEIYFTDSTFVFQMISSYTLSLWCSFLQHNVISQDEILLSFIPRLFETASKTLYKVIQGILAQHFEVFRVHFVMKRVHMIYWQKHVLSMMF